MEISSSLEALGSMLGVQGGVSRAGEGRSSGAAGPGPLGADHATLSSAASEVAQSAGEDGVRAGKVASIQAALTAGSYSVPASAVASRVVDAMLASGR